MRVTENEEAVVADVGFSSVGQLWYQCPSKGVELRAGVC